MLNEEALRRRPELHDFARQALRHRDKEAATTILRIVAYESGYCLSTDCAQCLVGESNCKFAHSAQQRDRAFWKRFGRLVSSGCGG